MDREISEILNQALKAFSVELPADYTSIHFIGPTAVLDSISLVSFLIEIEMLVFEKFKFKIVCLSDKALSRSQSPFRDYLTLKNYIMELVVNEKNIHIRD